MKKFLTKKATMIGSIVAAAVVLVLLLAFCIRPVSVGYSYTVSTESEYYGKFTVTYHFDTFSKVTLQSKYEKEEFASMEAEEQHWYFVKDGVLVVGPSVKSMEKEDFEKAKEEALKDWDKEEARNDGMLIDAFRIRTVDEGQVGEDKAVNGGAIATVVVLAVVDAVLVAGAVVLLIVKKRLS
jgi:hypothetical protein